MKVFILLLVALTVALADDLQCYECTNCKDESGRASQCTMNEDVCMKIENGNHVMRQCGNSRICGLGKAERAADRAWAAITNVFRDVDEDATLVHCCQDNLCNTGFKSMPSYLLLALPFILASLLKF